MWFFLLLLCGVIARTPVCPVCFDTLCEGTDKYLLHCVTTPGTCGLCNTSCIQCIQNASSPYVCQCPSPYPTASPTPPTKSPTSAPTYSPTEEPTHAPTKMPTPPPTPPIAPVVLLFSPTLAPTLQTNAPTRAPTVSPTIAPTLIPTVSPTGPPPNYRVCTYCNFTNPPPTRPCNDYRHKLQILCMAADNVTCLPCPSYCSFCYPLLAPTPSHVCTCPITGSPTLSPTKAPTEAPSVAPTGAPTTRLPTLISAENMNNIVTVTINIIIICFVCLVIVITVIFCCVIPESPFCKRFTDHEHEL